MRCYKIKVVPTVSLLFLLSIMSHFLLRRVLSIRGWEMFRWIKNQVKAVFFLAAIEIIEAVVFQ